MNLGCASNPGFLLSGVIWMADWSSGREIFFDTPATMSCPRLQAWGNPLNSWRDALKALLSACIDGEDRFSVSASRLPRKLVRSDAPVIFVMRHFDAGLVMGD